MVGSDSEEKVETVELKLPKATVDIIEQLVGENPWLLSVEHFVFHAVLSRIEDLCLKGIIRYPKGC